MKCFGKTSLNKFLGDRIVYRNLNAIDEALPGLKELCAILGVPNGTVPRKTSLDYARVIVQLLKEAQLADGKKEPLERVLYVGDTRMNDGTAFLNICKAGNWQGAAFITSEDQELTKLETEIKGSSILFFNNHWVNVRIFRSLAEMKGVEIDERTAVLIDMDKTALGARGRNDKVIDKVRITAAKAVLQELLTDDFCLEDFQAAYKILNLPIFHPFTADNQDYLVYICLILGSGLFKLEEIQAAEQSNQLMNFEQFLEEVEQQVRKLPEKVSQVHKEVYSLVKAGDPTPFKQFRLAEYAATISSMGQLEENASVDDLLESEIVVTREVQEFALDSTAAGALVFGLSDKPDEATANGSGIPLHKKQTHVVGGINERK